MKSLSLTLMALGLTLGSLTNAHADSYKVICYATHPGVKADGRQGWIPLASAEKPLKFDVIDLESEEQEKEATQIELQFKIGKDTVNLRGSAQLLDQRIMGTSQKMANVSMSFSYPAKKIELTDLDGSFVSLDHNDQTQGEVAKSSTVLTLNGKSYALGCEIGRRL